jgi:histidine triad (HIT) family protein
VLPRLARAVLSVTGATDYNVLQNNGRAAHQEVFHVHFHIIPRDGDAGLGIGWPSGRLDAEEAKALASELRAALGNEA